MIPSPIQKRSPQVTCLQDKTITFCFLETFSSFNSVLIPLLPLIYPLHPKAFKQVRETHSETKIEKNDKFAAIDLLMSPERLLIRPREGNECDLVFLCVLEPISPCPSLSFFLLLSHSQIPTQSQMWHTRRTLPCIFSVNIKILLRYQQHVFTMD